MLQNSEKSSSIAKEKIAIFSIIFKMAAVGTKNVHNVFFKVVSKLDQSKLTNHHPGNFFSQIFPFSQLFIPCAQIFFKLFQNLINQK